MNERIRELAEKAFYETALYGGKRGDMDFDTRYNQLFAELIVRKCIKVVEDMAAPEDSERYFWAIQNTSQNLKKHFGVEE